MDITSLQYVRKHLSASQLVKAQSIAKIAVSGVELVAKSYNLTGSDKLTAAINKAQELASKAGIKLTAEQWEGLIHSGLAEFKNVWNTLGEQVTPTTETAVTEVNPVLATAVVTAQAETVHLPQLPGRWVIGNDFICHFPVLVLFLPHPIA